MESLRRKSCECDDCGHTTKFQKKANLLMLNFQTRYYQKKMEMQRLLDIAEKERAKNATVLSNFYMETAIILTKFIRTSKKT